MRTLNAISLVITALALTVVCYQDPSVWNLLLSAALLATLVAVFALASSHVLTYVFLLVAAAAAYAAGSALGRGMMQLDGWPVVILGLLATAVVFTVIWRTKSRVRRVYKSDLLVMTGRWTPGMRVVTGPDYVLPLGMKILAVMPNNEQERTVTIEHVNVRPQPGPLGSVAQNINKLELELVYQVDPQAVMGVFGVHNRDDYFKQGEEAAGKRVPAAMADKQFWIKVWELALNDIAERHLRHTVHRSGLSAMAVSAQRDQIEREILEPIRQDALRIGLSVLECNIHNVEPDESRAALNGREILLQALARAEEIKLTGDAQAGARAAQVRAMVEAVKAAGGQVPPRIVELIVHGVLPHTVLSAYVPGLGAGDSLIDLQTRPGGRPGDPTRN